MNAPSWLKCGKCLWYKYANDPGEGWGCIISGEVKNVDENYRCNNWTCHRCFATISAIAEDYRQINHNHCEIIGRSKN